MLASNEAFGGASAFELEASGRLLWNQFLSIIVVMVYSFVVTFIIAKVLDRTIGLRVSEQAELDGLDNSEHSETAYLTGGSFERS